MLNIQVNTPSTVAQNSLLKNQINDSEKFTSHLKETFQQTIFETQQYNDTRNLVTQNFTIFQTTDLNFTKNITSNKQSHGCHVSQTSNLI